MSLQLLAGKEVIRTHHHWRLLMKRPIWSAEEALRRDEAQMEATPPSDLHALTTVMAVHEELAVGGDGPEAARAGRSSEAAPEPTRKQRSVGLQASNDAYYDDWLHRGRAEPLRSMCHYIYGMYVRPKPRATAASLGRPCFEFDHHYVKAKSYVQVLLYAPEVPYLHGFTVPSKDQDLPTNSLAHLVLFRPTRCPGASCCRDAAAPAQIYIGQQACAEPAAAACWQPGLSKPSAGASVTRGRKRFVEQWRAYEARLQALASERADTKIQRARKIATLTDVTSEREWWCPGAAKGTVVQKWLLPWLLGSGRHVYQGPNLAGGRPHLRRPRVPAARPAYTQADYRSGHPHGQRGVLAPLPLHAALTVLRFVGHVVDEDGAELFIANTAPDAQRAAEQARRQGRPFRFTSLGVHDDQLLPEEFFAVQVLEASGNLDLMAEARRRPRPSQLHPDAVADDPDGVQEGLGADHVEVAELAGECPDAEVDEAPVAKFEADPGLRYEPLLRVPESRVIDMVHRLNVLSHLDRRAGDRFANIQLFHLNHEQTYAAVHEQAAVCGAWHLPQSGRQQLQPQRQNEALKRQAWLRESRKGLEEEVAAELDAQLSRDCPSAGPEATCEPPPVVCIEAPSFEETPTVMARRLMAESGVANSEDQYNASLLAIYPLQRLYEWAFGEGRLQDFAAPHRLQQLLADAPREFVQRLFLHGPGGSGKTYFVNEVVLPVLRRFCPGAFQAMASQNSAARLIGGATMHAMAAMTRNQALTARKPGRAALEKLKKGWEALACILLDEASLMPPELLAMVNARAGWARSELLHLLPGTFAERPFGDILLQIMLGDFLQLNPVRSHSLLEAFLEDTEVSVPRVPEATTELDRQGYSIFRQFCQQVVLFRGTHRFVAGDPLVQLLEIMRAPGGQQVPEWLREAILARVQRGEEDPRAAADYAQHNAHGEQIGPAGFFARGFFSAINWEQVARLEQLWARQAALRTVGPTALQNSGSGRPQRLCWAWPPAACKHHASSTWLPAQVQALISWLAHGRAQLIYYVQAVDLPQAKGLQGSLAFVEQALAVANRNSTGGLSGLLPLFLGMRVKLTKKLLAPELVQEASGEVVGIAFHDEEGFGRALPARAPAGPPASHPCWQRGWVMLDRLPKYVAVRFDEQGEDYTGLGRPGVYLVEPNSDTWTLKYRTAAHVDHPLAPARVRQSKITNISVRRFQLPLAPERVGTYQGQQGKTIRGPDKEPLGHTVDLRKPAYMETSEYKQHLYMILGRARALDWCLFQNFPLNAAGEPDWSLFETGPPDFLVHFFRVLEAAAQATAPAVEWVRQELAVFPPWARRPVLLPDPAKPGRFLFSQAAWDEAMEPCIAGLKRSTSEAAAGAARKRLRKGQSTAAGLLRQQARPLAAAAESAASSSGG